MSFRAQAARDALDRTGAELTWGMIDIALTAADAVMFSDEAVERAAKAMPHDQICGGWAPCDCWELRKTIVRSAIAALKGDA